VGRLPRRAIKGRDRAPAIRRSCTCPSTEQLNRFCGWGMSLRLREDRRPKRSRPTDTDLKTHRFLGRQALAAPTDREDAISPLVVRRALAPLGFML